jgi:tRNA A58 N-methylase Trm61
MHTLRPVFLAAILIALLCLAGCGGHSSAAEADKAAQAAAWRDPARDAWQKPDVVLAQLGPLHGKTVLDLGAGSGYFTYKLAALADTVIAVEADTFFYSYLLGRRMQEPALGPRVKVLLMAPNGSDLPPACADVVLLVDVYEHLPQPWQYCGRLHKVLRPGGKLVVVSPKNTDLNDALANLGRAGFRSLGVDSTSLPRQFMVTAQ